MEPIDPFHQLPNRRHHGIELDADGSILACRFDDDGEFQIVREIKPSAERSREYRSVDPVKLENLFSDSLVLSVKKSARSGSGKALVEEFQVCRDAVISRIVAAE